MKNLLTAFFAGVLMSALCAGLTACNEPKGLEVIGVLPVSESDLPDEVTAFFENYLPESNDSRPPHEFNFGDVDNYDTVCLMINSMEEFKTVAPPSAELPEINFDKYTLVIGQHAMGDPGYRLKIQSVDSGPDVMILNLVYEILEGGSPQIVSTFNYWGLYPKLPQKPIEVNLTTI